MLNIQTLHQDWLSNVRNDLLAGFVVALALGLLASTWLGGNFWGWSLLGLLVLRLGMGVANVLFALPLALAVAHNLGAAALLSATLAINIRLHQTKSPWQDKLQGL